MPSSGFNACYPGLTGSGDDGTNQAGGEGAPGTNGSSGGGGGGGYGGGGGGATGSAGGGGGSSYGPSGTTYQTAAMTAAPQVIISWSAPAITSASTATFTAGQFGDFTVSTTGVPTASLARAGGLPSGVTFTPNMDGTATLSGTPAAGTAGSYPLTIEAQNGNSPAAQQTFTLVVQGPPVVVISTPAANGSYTQGQTVDASYSCADPNGPGASCAGTVANGQPIDTSTTGSQSFSVTATSSDGLTTSDTVSYTVNQIVGPTTPPSPAPTAQASVTPGQAGLTYVFSAAGSSGNGSAITGYAWSLGGQSIGTGPSITHTFSASGQVQSVELTVTDVDGKTTTTSIQVTPNAVSSVARSTVHFATNKAGLTTADRLALDPLRGIFAQAERVQVNGFCAYKETSYNRALTSLSKDRAQAVLDLLKAFSNPTAGKVKIQGYAASHFLATNRTATGQAQNRRATLVITYLRPVS